MWFPTTTTKSGYIFCSFFSLSPLVLSNKLTQSTCCCPLRYCVQFHFLSFGGIFFGELLWSAHIPVHSVLYSLHLYACRVCVCVVILCSHSQKEPSPSALPTKHLSWTNTIYESVPVWSDKNTIQRRMHNNVENPIWCWWSILSFLRPRVHVSEFIWLSYAIHPSIELHSLFIYFGET